MRKRLHKVLITGGAGFIGSEFVRLAVSKGYNVAVVDKLTYAADLARLESVRGKITFYKADICNKSKIDSIFKREKPAVLVHFAAETHVDRSIQNASSFLDTNVRGTHILLEAARKHRIHKFVHISTDEVYGEIKKGKFDEASSLNPGNPYSVSKASADLLIKAYVRTYNFPAMIVRPSNNYGLWQYPEKLLPVVIFKALINERVPVYGQGKNKREWLYVKDCAQAILTVTKKGKLGEIYNLGSGYQKRNIDTVKQVIKMLGKDCQLIQFVEDRPGHDFRYALDSSKISKLGWKPNFDFEDGIKETVGWYSKNVDWLAGKRKMLERYWSKVYFPIS
ncbi:MAG: dTDP-glucose 4,6-dehydratase [Candidatus Omnitrophota bacterium]|nr:MAG: dTDP-glucose 4,6-dehydratase [Candidatus Omnitrophota bacterium]